ncbi:KRAB-A domain-containing protein 2-like [Photinus pyralis]|nr:KRAB-A domain-containing protein 2-like [Photinus pyralis]
MLFFYSGRKERREYFLLSTYDVMTVGNNSYLIKQHGAEDKIEYVVAYEELYEKLDDVHTNKTGHGGRIKMEAALRMKYSIPRPAIELFISCCEPCNEKKQGRKKIVVRPIVSKDFNERGQVDLIDFQSMPDSKFKWIMNYQDHSTKFIFLRALESKRAEEVAKELLSIFLLIGAPKILQSDNGREFVNRIITDLKTMWPECLLVHGRPRHPQSQGSIERANKDVEDMIRAWMHDNNSKKWSIGLQFLQWQKNISFHRTIGRSPYKALLGSDPKLGLTSSNIPLSLAKTIETEEELQEILNDRPAEAEELLNCENVSENVDNDGENEENDIENNENYTDNIETDVLSACVTDTVVHHNPSCQLDRCCICEEELNSENKVRCDKCQQNVHPNCISASCSKEDADTQLCQLCFTSSNILRERQATRTKTEEAAKKMLNSSTKKLPKLKKGDCVLLSTPKVDRGPGDPLNLICIIMDQKNGVNQLACQHGMLKGWFGPECLSLAGAAFLSIHAINTTRYLSIREAVMMTSGGQGFVKCMCKPGRKQCNSARCICMKNKSMCTSRCHQSLPCSNK